MADYGAWQGLGSALQTGGDAFARAKAARRAQEESERQAARQDEQDSMARQRFGEESLDAMPQYDAPPALGLPTGFKLNRKEALNTGMSLAQRQAEAAQAKQKQAKAFDEDQFKRENALRDEYAKASKDFETQTGALGRIEKSVKDPSAAGDLALIFNYMKMLDPGSTVREGEFANAQNAAGIPDQILNAYNKALKGERLNPAQRQDFYKSGRRTYGGALGSQGQVRKRYQELAGRYRIAPENVVNISSADPKWFEEGGFNPDDLSALGIQAQDERAEYEALKAKAGAK